MTQKLALACSLCLTVAMIVLTIIRIAGIDLHNHFDTIWVTFWQFLAAEIGLILAAMTAFRSLYVSRTKERRLRSPEDGSLWSSRNFLYRRFGTWGLRSTGHTSSEADAIDVNIPGGTITGVRTFIKGPGKTKDRNSLIMLSEDDDDVWPLSENMPRPGGI